MYKCMYVYIFFLHICERVCMNPVRPPPATSARVLSAAGARGGAGSPPSLRLQETAMRGTCVCVCVCV
jgi:hypothetical protein